MRLPRRQDLGSHINDPIFGARDLANALPKYRFPAHENRTEDICQVVSDELYLDRNARQNLATFCQTWEEPEVHKLMNLAIDKNMIDKTEYPQTAEIEIRCTHMLADLWNGPAAATTVGTSTIGSSEACMLGGMAAKWRWKARHKAQCKPTDKPNLVCGPVQVCWAKFCRYWEIEKREIPMRPGMFHMMCNGCWRRSMRTRLCRHPDRAQRGFDRRSVRNLRDAQAALGADPDSDFAPFTWEAEGGHFGIPTASGTATSGVVHAASAGAARP
jgi:glutamate/tyrosine decarboxylase-like PLP-dependent enzyme